MIVSIKQEIFSCIFIACAQIEGKAKAFRIPISAASIFFPCKTFWPNIEARIITGVGLLQMKNIESNPLLGSLVSINPNIRMIPNLSPAFNVLKSKRIVAQFMYIVIQFSCLINKLLFVIITAVGYSDKFAY